MSRLDQEHDVIALARELGLRGNPVEAVVRFCEEKIGCWAADFGARGECGGVGTTGRRPPASWSSRRCVRTTIWNGSSPSTWPRANTCSPRCDDELDPTTFGLTIKRKHCGPESGDKYVAVIDCRGEKATRRFFTRWHEIAHLLVLEKELRCARAPILARPHRAAHGRDRWPRRVLRAALRSCLRPRAQTGLSSNSRPLRQSAMLIATRRAFSPRCSPATGE